MLVCKSFTNVIWIIIAVHVHDNFTEIKFRLQQILCIIKKRRKKHFNLGSHNTYLNMVNNHVRNSQV